MPRIASDRTWRLAPGRMYTFEALRPDDYSHLDDYNHQMTKYELLNIVRAGEDTRHEFKVDVTNAKSIGAELAAFANGSGGWLIVGVTDEGQTVGFDKKNVRRINSLIANAASHNVRPAVEFTTQNIQVSDAVIVVVTIPSGTDKPYFDSEGVVWQRIGSTKSRVHAKEQLRRIFQDSDFLQGDAVLIQGTGPESLDLDELATVLIELGDPPPRSEKAAWERMKGLGLVRKNRLTLAGLLLFGKKPTRIKPEFSLKAVCYHGREDISDTYVDSEVYEGRLTQLYEGALAFLRRNLRKVQVPGESVNSRGKMEIPKDILDELLCNALLHRDYLIEAPIRLLVFKDRIEIMSPGLLPGGLTIDNISNGSIYIRNPNLTSYAIRGLLPYRGLGSGIRRVLKTYPEVRLENDTAALMFRAVVPRPTNLAGMRRLLVNQANAARFTEERQKDYDRRRSTSLLRYRPRRISKTRPLRRRPR
jgi:ATP-dependent DNA helicase RecG